MRKRKLTRKPDNREVNIHDEYAVEYWARQFGVPKTRVFAAVEVVGSSASKVKSHLNCKYLKKGD